MQGWECPKCGKVYAPHVDECKHCNEGMNMKEINEKYFPNVPDSEEQPIITPTVPTPFPYVPQPIHHIWRTAPNTLPLVPQWPYYPNLYVGDLPFPSPFTVTCETNSITNNLYQ
jgi:hypothetical protein